MNFYISTFNNKKFLFLVFTVTLLMIIMQFLFLEYYTREKTLVMDPQTKRLVEKHNYKLALLGTSHTNYGDEMNKIDSEMFNYGMAYTYPIVMYQKMKKLIAFNPNLKYLLVESDYHQFYDSSFTESAIYTTYAFLLKDIKTGNENLFYSLNREIAPTLHKRIFVNLKSRIWDLDKSKNDPKPYEGDWSKVSQKLRNKYNMARYNSFGFSNDSEMNENSIDYYQKTIELAQKNNIKVILIRHPQTNEYLENMYKNIKINVDKYIDVLSIKYNLWDTYNLSFDIGNILDEKYETTRDYSQMDRSYNFGIRRSY